ncbi:alpha/beta hydrolase [Nocardia fusca]|uniref:Alpha/beta hydrolase n=1 Tax=Nocardia fusca TaxID=941183 RepID=A0ABV3F856_9NOCA
MGTAISDGLYRRTRDAVLRDDYDFITADENGLRVLRELLRQETPARVTAPRVPDIGLPENPRDLREAWDGLSRSEKEELFQADPYIGNRGGIPQADRDFYNRRTLQNLWQQARAAGDNDRTMIYHEMMRMLNVPVGGQPPFYLSHIDAKGRVAFSLDNPDLADNNVVLLKPAGPEDPVGYAEPNLRQLRRIALAVEPKARTSVTFCGVYDQPKSMVQAIFPQFAQDGAALVRNYHEGLRASHMGAPAHTTTIGHSYAGVVGGHAAGRGATLDSDNMLFMGNWGTGADHVDELSLRGVAPDRTAENVFATMAPRDSVQLMPSTHGTPPTDPEFGARVFSSGSAPGDGRWSPYDHAARNYLNSSNPSAGKIGLIITGHGDLVS